MERKEKMKRCEVLCKRIFCFTEYISQCEAELMELGCDSSFNGSTEDEWNSLVCLPPSKAAVEQNPLPEVESPCMIVADLLQELLSTKAECGLEIQSSWQLQRADRVHWYISGTSALPKV